MRKLLANIKLVRDINSFYKNYYEGTYTKLRLKDLKNKIWLLEVQYDLNEFIYEYDEFDSFLDDINERLNDKIEEVNE